MKIKTPDLTTGGQKVGAAFVLGLAALILWLVLPPIVEILKNIWLCIALGVPLVIISMTYDIIWEETKRSIWNITKKRISNDPLWYMWRGYDYLISKNNDLNKDILSISSLRIQNEKKQIQLALDYDQANKDVIAAESANIAQPLIKVKRNKVALLKTQLDNTIPRTEMLKKQESDLNEIYQNRVADAEILKQTLEAKAEELEQIKAMSNATKNASAWLENNPQMKTFRESLREIDIQISNFTSNVENFQRNVLPMISSGKSSNLDEQGAILVEEYKKNRLLLT